MDSEQEWPQQVEEKFLQQEEQKEEQNYPLNRIERATSNCGLSYYKETNAAGIFPDAKQKEVP